ncbi:hypothetical protein VCUG_00663 [Vavraia culicis subsp. floridensis]|uniref:Uncharacterized protein n=1 Tax=Vavraia culicis (isolate floridensis) TaxID=948595 RepID=L2GVW9_VAVCU|nr:uncharacterized protein VCUG_00663 [Vavraia culicis subsp. floridensis]ELA47821.1 hypothetical protein VCUG_00663 [Vavraia culicis subsp. floridensis]
MMDTFRIFKLSIKKNTETYHQFQQKNAHVSTQEIYHLQYSREIEHEEWSHLFNNLIIHIDNVKIVIQQFNNVILVLNILDEMSIRISKVGKVMAIRWYVEEKIQIKFYTEQESTLFHERINETVVGNLRNCSKEKAEKVKKIIAEFKKINRNEESATNKCDSSYDDIKREFIELVNKRL